MGLAHYLNGLPDSTSNLHIECAIFGTSGLEKQPDQQTMIEVRSAVPWCALVYVAEAHLGGCCIFGLAIASGAASW